MPGLQIKMKKLIIMLMLGFIGQAQEFDFGCDPLPAKVIILQNHPLGNMDGLFVVINAIEPINGLTGLPVFLNDTEGIIVSSTHFLEKMRFVIIGVNDQQKLIDKFNNNELIYLNTN